MKNIKYLLLLFFINQLGFAQFQQNNTPTNQHLYDICFIDESYGLAVGDSGTIIQSSDGGVNWDLVFFADSINLRKVKFFDSQHVIATGSHLLRSTNGGLTWSVQNQTNDLFYDIEILNDSSAILSGSPIAIMNSFDKGLTWNILIDENPEEEFGFLSFVDENIGYTCRGNQSGPILQIMKTTNGGLSWLPIEIQSGIGNTIIEDLCFISENTGYKCGWYESHLTKTNNAGINWQYINYADSTLYPQLKDLHIRQDQPNAYYACGWYGTIFKSTNEGDTWSEIITGLPTENEIFNGIYFIDENTGWVAGTNGIILKTTNGGEPVSITKDYNSPKLEIYPNPTNGILYLENKDGLRVEKITILNQSGRIIFETEEEKPIQLKNIPAGLYIVLITTTDGSFMDKIIVN